MKKNKPLLQRVTKALTAEQDKIRDRELARTAHHEAGHAVAHAILGGSGQTTIVTLADDPDDLIGTGTCYTRGFPGSDAHEAKARMIVLAAGAEAMKRYDPHCDGGGQCDDSTIRKLALDLHGCLGSKKRRQREIATARRRARTLVRLYWPQIEATAKRLIENHLFLSAIPRRSAADL